MASKDFKFHLFLTPHGTTADPSYMLTDSNMEAHGYLRIKDVTVTVELPELENIRQKRLDALDRAEQSMKAQYAAALTELARKRSELLALENCVESA